MVAPVPATVTSKRPSGQLGTDLEVVAELIAQRREVLAPHAEVGLHRAPQLVHVLRDVPPLGREIEVGARRHRRVGERDGLHPADSKGALTAVGVGEQVPGVTLLDDAERADRARRRPAVAIGVAQLDLTPFDDRVAQRIEMSRVAARADSSPRGIVDDDRRRRRPGRVAERCRQGLQQLAQRGLGGRRHLRRGADEEEERSRLGLAQSGQVGARAPDELPAAAAAGQRVQRDARGRQRLEVAAGGLDRDLELLGQLGRGHLAAGLQDEEGRERADRRARHENTTEPTHHMTRFGADDGLRTRRPNGDLHGRPRPTFERRT